MPRYTRPRRTWHYLNEFKVKAVQLSLLDGVQVKEIADTLDIHPFMLSRWRKEYREGKLKADKQQLLPAMKKDKEELERIKKLEKENARLKLENDLLKKWQRFLAEEHQSDLDSFNVTGKTSE